ncbi:hypothetical protein Tco_0370406 [Tanacetum coccineum]
MKANALLAARLQEKEREQFSIDEQARFLVETIAERKRVFAAQRAEQIRNKPPTKTQLRNKMITYLKNMGRFTYNKLKNKSFEEIQKLYEKEQKWIKDFIPWILKKVERKQQAVRKDQEHVFSVILEDIEKMIDDPTRSTARSRLAVNTAKKVSQKVWEEGALYTAKGRLVLLVSEGQ